jgi:hypothetical protein
MTRKLDERAIKNPLERARFVSGLRKQVFQICYRCAQKSTIWKRIIQRYCGMSTDLYRKIYRKDPRLNAEEIMFIPVVSPEGGRSAMLAHMAEAAFVP